ncbi:universal stress protein [Phytoactinopolyspora limicola]|uniref:universal stress protein n=1 Tax=Phytoactinopolyspora limicola TaxID=2715536 RepID=UPI00140A1742|nr:universal stress protein [Phytoactinopolyspora limicola]
MTISPQNLEVPGLDVTTVAPIAVGVDGTEPCLAAVEWAAAEAVRVGASLELVHAYPATVIEYPVTPVGRQRAEIAFAAARERLAASPYTGVTMTTRATQGSPSRILLRSAKAARMVVLGRTHTGRVSGLLSTSTAVACASGAKVPVTVVPASWSGAGVGVGDEPVVVGVDGSERCQPAIRHAFEVAADLGVGVQAVLALDLPAGYPQGWPIGNGTGFLREDGRRSLQEVLESPRLSYPDVKVDAVVDERSPADALMDYGRTGNRIVIGGRGHGLVTGALLGSVARTILRRAPSPVTVVHSP